MRYVLCGRDKRPFGRAWQNRSISEEELRERHAADPDAVFGILLGPQSGVVDVECDSQTATANYQGLLGHLRAPCFQSARGVHHLFQYDPRFSQARAVVKIDEIEYRLGGSAAAQSICPPSVVGGVERVWIIHPEECAPPPLPESVIATILTYRTTKADFSPDPMFADFERQLQAANVAKLTTFLTKHDYAPTRREYPDGRIELAFPRCPFKTAGHDNGNCAVTVFTTGHFGFHCFHAKDNEKTWTDVEDVLGERLNPVIRLGPDLHRVVSEAITALASDPTIYQRGALVEVTHPAPQPELALGDNGAARLRVIPSPILAARLSAVARFERRDSRRGKWTHSKPDSDVVKAISSSAGYPGIPVATGVVSSPVLRSDGTVAAERGYDLKTGLYIDVDGGLPPLMDVTAAVRLLSDVFCDFPFETAAHRTGAIAALVSLVSRPAYDGCAPLFAFDANTSGTGKGLATDVIAMIFEGRRAARYTLPKDQDELRKAVTSAVISGQPYVLLDNVKSKLGGASLEAAITATRWKDRILGLNQEIDLPINLVWLATGNNIALTGDMPRRVVHVRLSSDLERPDARTGFKYPNLLGYVNEHRRDLLIAALSIPARYIAAGCPDQRLPPWGGFEAWSDLVRSALVWAGLADCDSRQTLRDDSDEETDVLAQLLEAWTEMQCPMTVPGALRLAESGLAPKLADLVSGFADKANALGALLRTHRGRVLGGRRLDRSGRPAKWFIT